MVLAGISITNVWFRLSVTFSDPAVINRLIRYLLFSIFNNYLSLWPLQSMYCHLYLAKLISMITQGLKHFCRTTACCIIHELFNPIIMYTFRARLGMTKASYDRIFTQLNEGWGLFRQWGKIIVSDNFLYCGGFSQHSDAWVLCKSTCMLHMGASIRGNISCS